MISLPRIKNLIKVNPQKFIIRNDRKIPHNGCFIAIKGHPGVIGKIDRRALCHFDVELKMTVDKVEFYEFV